MNRFAISDRARRSFGSKRAGIVVVVGFASLTACGSAAPVIFPPSISVAVTPETVGTDPGATQDFPPTVTGISNPSAGPSVASLDNSALGLDHRSRLHTVAADASASGMQELIRTTQSHLTRSGHDLPALNRATPTPALTGATYETELSSWENRLLPLVQNLSGLIWDATSRTWTPTPNWAPSPAGMAEQIYYLEMYLRPATRLAIARHDVPLMEELADFHMAMLRWRTTTVGQAIQNGGSNAIVFISGPLSARTFPWYDPDGTQVRVRDDPQASSQYLSQAAQLLRAIANLPAAERSTPLTGFVQGFSGFLVSEQLLRLMYGSTPWSHYQNPNIPQPVVSAWQFLAQTGYEPPYPIKYEAAMTDTELWLVADSAEVLGADAAAPALAILNNSTRAQLQQAVQAGVSLIQARSHHQISPDGTDVLSVFAGDYDDYPSVAYAGDTGPATPTTPNPMTGLSWDISHSYRFPIVFRSLYETESATGVTFPALNDVVALANTYVHLAFTGNPQLPTFDNFLDGWNGWLDVGDPGYPPQQYCNAMQSPINCLTAGAVQGWGQLAFANPGVAALMQNLIDLAYDSSAADQSFIDQHYYYDDGPYAVTGNQYPWLMIYVVGDSAERLP